MHIDLFRPSRILSLGGKSYALVYVDDHTRYTWVLFLAHKNETFYNFSKLCKRIQNEKSLTICSILSDHDREFENDDFIMFCDDLGIYHNFSAPRTP